MKFSIASVYRIAITWTIVLIALTLVGCEAADTASEDTGFLSLSADEGRQASARLGSQTSLDGVRARGDAAFASLQASPDRKSTRSSSRIGPQPWPLDLPEGWPRPRSAKVLADTRRNGDRLLLVDMPSTADRAASQFRDALKEVGYVIDRADTNRISHALHARSADHEVVLTFIARNRERSTRVEILFIDPGKRTTS